MTMADLESPEMIMLLRLETQVKLAAEEIGNLRARNDELESEVARLVAELEEVTAADNGGWEEERQQVRERVEKLVLGLEQLLES